MTLNLHPPAEWAPHSAVWTAWPWDASTWPGNDLAGPRAEVAGMIRALAQTGRDGRAGDRMRVLVHGNEARASAQAAIGDVAELVEAAYGDIWLRDIGPIFHGAGHATTFAFNGWGGKFIYPHDETVSASVVKIAGVERRRCPYVIEGGSLDWDGEGTVLTTRECLLNPNRNPGMTEEKAEKLLADTLGMKRVVWLGEGLINDHTDGHVDNIARFVAPGVVVCQRAADGQDPNAARLDAIAADLAAVRDARGRMLQVIRIPSPGLVTDEDGEIIPASHMNFLIGNSAVVVPVYGTPSAASAIDVLKPLFPGRAVIGLPARHILSGGGAFHCITQQQPA
jgi:agmatine deiminase